MLSILPSYLSLWLAGSQFLMAIRILRLLRVFRVLRLYHFLNEARLPTIALQRSFYKIGVFFLFMLVLVTLLGTVIYVVEYGHDSFNSIPEGIYWAIVTVTTVGYGDVVPTTVVGKFIASFSMILGYTIIAVPTSIVSVELGKTNFKDKAKHCSGCDRMNVADANFCCYCGDRFK